MTRRTHTQAATSVAVDWDIAEGDDFDALMITLTFDAAPTTPENLTVTLDSVLGGSYDSTLVTIDPRGHTSVVVTGITGAVKGDVITVAYANSDTNSITGTASVDIYQRTFSGDVTNPSKIGVYLDGVQQVSASSVRDGTAAPVVLKTSTFANTTGAPVIYTVTGDVILRVLAVGKTSLTSAGACNAELGISGATDTILATTDVTAIDAGEIWHDATPDADIEAESVSKDFVIVGGADVILTLSAQVDAGVIAFYGRWVALSADGNVVAA